MEGDKRKRSSNWTEQEKRVLLSLVRKRIEIVENKCLSTAVTSRKEEAWKNIYSEFSVRFGDKKRSIRRLKEQWKRMKMKHNLLKHKKGTQVNDTGSEGNEKAVEWDIMASLPSDAQLDIVTDEIVIAPCSPVPGTSAADPLSSPLEESADNECLTESQTCGWGVSASAGQKKDSRMTEYDREMLQLYKQKHVMRLRHEEELHQESIRKAKLEQQKLMLEIKLLEKQLNTAKN